MDEADRQLLRRFRVRLVGELQVAALWDALLNYELFTPDMIEDIQVRTRPSRGPQFPRRMQASVTDGNSEAALRGLLELLRNLKAELPLPLPRLCQLVTTSFGEPSCGNPVFPHGGEPTELRGGTKRSQTSPLPLPRWPLTFVFSLFLSPGAQEGLRGNADLVYVLNADPCGHCLIINNVHFCLKSGLSTRPGSNVDCEKLQRRFRSLHFMVEVKCDLTGKQIVQALVELAQRDHGALDCCVVVILSHGCQASHLQFPGAVYGTDGFLVSIEKIVNIFNGTGCPSLGGKPKLFFIQACGGEQKDCGFAVVSTSPEDRAPGSNPEPDAVPFQDRSGSCDQPDAVSNLPTPSDIFVSYSTFPGFVSWRDPKSGSWYIETLDKIFEQWAHSEDLHSLLLRVANAVSQKGIYKQIPGCFNFLRKKLFFKTS
ncbi:caspase-9 [Pteropus vampyrus]|uniref:Caspase-9 n=1 Tax=Pteropus vampyrus TaxID=132908 RepID=A0A6P6CM38_PTEVA|nr:caspase-9 [Pteropus vampyrus]